jgi:methionine-rich copper-binding protein CopC
VTRVLALAAVVALVSVAHAHSTLVRALPAARSTVKAAPERVQLWFSERLEPAYSSASVWRVGRAA